MNKPLKILLADDHPIVRKVYLAICQQIQGIEFEIVKDGEQALAALMAGEYDILFTDYNMPRLNGVELIQQARALGLKLVIVMIAANPPEEHGADHVIFKPIGDELRKFILNALAEGGRHE